MSCNLVMFWHCYSLGSLSSQVSVEVNLYFKEIFELEEILTFYLSECKFPLFCYSLQTGESRFEGHERIRYTRDLLLQLREVRLLGLPVLE